MKRILVLGGGASGIVAAISAAEHAAADTEVILLEQNAKLGKKLLATGNGRCNLDNLHCSTDHYFTSSRETAAEMLEYIAQINLPQWFAARGLLCREADEGRLYPYSNQAADVVNLLTYRLKQTGVQIYTDCRVTNINRNHSVYIINTADGAEFYGDAVICAMGGNAGPQFGSEGFGIRAAFRANCLMEPLYPCLVPLKCNPVQVQGLSGIRVKAEAALYDGDTHLHTENGEIQFTDYGLSGIAIMQLSGWLGPQYNLNCPNIRLNLFPHYTVAALTDLLFSRVQQMPGASVADYMVGLVHPQAGLAVWQAQQLGDINRTAASVTREEWGLFAHGLQNWTFADLADIGWKHAQTTGGGIALQQLESYSFQLKDSPGLYFTGETADCAGYCGGYNLHWAFGSGILAGKHAAETLKNQKTI